MSRLYDFSDPDIPETKKKLKEIPDEIWKHVFVCGLCGFMHENQYRFARHIKYYHVISYVKYVVKVRYNNVWPRCEECKTAYASKGMSVFYDYARVLCSKCNKERFGPKGLIARVSYKLIDHEKKMKYPKYPPKTAEMYEAKKRTLAELYEAGIVDEVENRYYTYYADEKIGKFRHIEETTCDFSDSLPKSIRKKVDAIKIEEEKLNMSRSDIKKIDKLASRASKKKKKNVVD